MLTTDLKQVSYEDSYEALLSRKTRLKTGESEQEPVAALHSPGVVAVLQYTVASILVAAAVAAGYYLICIIRENLHYIIQHCIALFAVHT